MKISYQQRYAKIVYSIVLTENATGAVTPTFVVFMSAILIGLCLSAILFPGTKDRTLLK
jgi:hypothetical protein